MGKREENTQAKQLKEEIIGAIKNQLKGSSWKKKHDSFFCETNDNFYCVSPYALISFDNSIPFINLKASFTAKPKQLCCGLLKKVKSNPSFTDFQTPSVDAK